MKESFEQEIDRPAAPNPSAPDTTDAPIKDAFSYYKELARVRQFVEANLEAGLSLTEASRIARLSPKYFSAFFKLHTGIRFRDWITDLRIQRAKALLVQENHTVSRLARAVGFRDVRTFQRAFKKVTGMTPITFKKSVAP